VKRLWLLFFPLLFLPNFGLSRQTPFGVIEISDWLILPFLALLLPSPSARYPQSLSRLRYLLFGFLLWACFTTLSIPARYDYLNDVPVLVGCFLKLAKLAVYVAAGFLIGRKLSDSRTRGQWLWSLLAALVMLSVGLMVSTNDPEMQSTTDVLQGYKSYNSIIVSMAILCTYTAGLWIDNVGSRKWRVGAAIALGAALCSIVISASLSNHGRGGWLGLIVGCGYFLWKRTANFKAMAIALVLALTAFIGYSAVPDFRSLVDSTISPDPAEEYSVSGVNDGARISTWVHEAPKLVNAPLLGTGFYHRGGPSGLWDTGAHNFFIQIFLETGIVGGILMMMIFVQMWRQAGSAITLQQRIGTPTRAALIAAIVAGMSGEYFYGGAGVLVLCAIFAYAGSLPLLSMIHVKSNRGPIKQLRQVIAS
jgi:O-antigen ligase